MKSFGFGSITVAGLCALLGFASPAFAESSAGTCGGADGPGPDLTIERLDALERAAAAFKSAAPADAADPLAVAMEAAPTPEGLSQWIATTTVLRPYRGTLRGAKGVLADRQGNTLDRSLLLAELLTFSGYDVRLARATLTAADLDRVKARLGRTAEFAKFAPLAPEHLPTLGVDDDADSKLEIACALALAFRIEDQTDRLLTFLKALGIDSHDKGAIDHALADHWWVQYSESGRWHDLDPTGLTGLEPEWTGAAQALPADLVHEVSVQVTARVVRDGGPEEVPLIALRDAAANFSQGVIRLSFEPKGIGKGDPAKIEPWLDSIGSARRWAPVLSYRDQVWGGRIFGFDGTVSDYEPGLAGQARATAKTGGGLLGGITNGRGSPKEAAAGSITALWIDYQVHVPGQPAIQERRTIFDVSAGLGAGGELSTQSAAQRASALMGQHEIYVTSADPDAFALYAHSIDETLALIGQIRSLLDRSGGATPKDLASMTNLIPRPVPVGLYGLISVRSELSATSPTGLYTSPAIFSFWTKPGPAFKTALGGFDIVRNDAPIGLSLAEAVRLGVIDTVLENFLLSGWPGGPENASTSFATTSAWRAVAADGDLSGLAIPDQTLALIRTELARGYVVIVPQDGQTPASYWRIDPKTGTTLGMTATGTGGAGAEYAKAVRDIALKSMTTIGCMQGAYKLAFSPDGNLSVEEVVSLVGCGFSAFKTLQSVAKFRKISRFLDKFAKSKKFRQEYGRYTRIKKSIDQIKDKKARAKYFNRIGKKDTALYATWRDLDDIKFDDAKIVEELIGKIDKRKLYDAVEPFVDPVKKLGLFFWKMF